MRKLQSAADEEGRQERTAGSAYAMGLLHHPALASLLSVLSSGGGPPNSVLTEWAHHLDSNSIIIVVVVVVVVEVLKNQVSGQHFPTSLCSRVSLF
jgi:hypothetical protein